MTIKHSRAQRRHDRARLKEKRQFHWGYGHKDEWIGRTPDNVGEINYMSPSVAGGVVNTPTPCSCYMCGNPRTNNWGENPLTMQEKKALESYIDQVEYYNHWGDWEDILWDDHDAYWWHPTPNDPAEDWYLRWMYINESRL